MAGDLMHANGSLGSVLVDSAIAGGSAFVGLAAGMSFGVVRADPLAFVYASAIAFLVAFFASLQAARGRKTDVEGPPG